VMNALNSATSGPIAEGNVGGGTGMLCYEFKGGTGTSSQKLPEKFGGWTVGVLAQCNFGRRYQLTIGGVPIGNYFKNDAPVTSGENPFRQEMGSLIVIVATDAPLLPHQLKRMAKRVTLGMGRTGALGGNGSGDIFLAFSTANAEGVKSENMTQVQALPNSQLDPIFGATVYATEEAIINALVAAEDMIGHEITAKALPHDELKELLKKYNRFQ
jgi:D-aminopeptidase